MVKIAAFGALNTDSYLMFGECINARDGVISAEVISAKPYPNKQAVSEKGRPLRGEALTNDLLKEDLLTAVANDALELGDDFDFYCMPCMSMIGFHAGIEKKLGKPIVSLFDALVNYYKDVDRVGVIHMRPAKKRVEEIFGTKVITPNEEQLEKLLQAENNSDAVVKAMQDITENFVEQGLSHVLLARADAPMAIKTLNKQGFNIQISSYFDILAKSII